MSTTEQTLRVTVEPGGTRASSGKLVYRVTFPDGRRMMPYPTAEEMQVLGLTPPLPPEPEVGFVIPVADFHLSWRSAQAPVGEARWYPVNHPQAWTPDPYLTWEQLNAEHGPLTIFTPTTGGN